jgi:hypothetical protein
LPALAVSIRDPSSIAATWSSRRMRAYIFIAFSHEPPALPRSSAPRHRAQGASQPAARDPMALAPPANIVSDQYRPAPIDAFGFGHRNLLR